MAKKITFLGIETSCDETAAAVIRENDNGTADILSNIVSSQIEEHKKFGGVVPELAARAHLENIEYIIETALKESKITIEDIDGVAATAGPGLIVCLTVGLNIGKSIAAFSNKPFVGVNHLEGLKTAVLRESKKINGEIKLKYNLAASFQNTINRILYKKTKVAVDMFKEKTQKENFQLIVAGGVAANESIRNNLSNLSKELNFKTIYPDLKFCGDNAAMIAWAGIQRFKKNLIDDVDVAAKSRWPLDKDAPYMKGPGLKL
jgi:tRNA A37 threonylcarbamoyltransferase TsaD